MSRQVNDGKERSSSLTADRPGFAQQNPEAFPSRQANAEAITPDDPKELATTRLRRLLPTAWAMIRPYWSSQERWAAWGLLLLVVALTLGMVYFSVLFNQWNNMFFTALQDRNNPVFLQLLMRLFWLVHFTIFFFF